MFGTPPPQFAHAESTHFPLSYSFVGAEISYVDSGNSRNKTSNIDNLDNYPEYGLTLGHQFNPNFTLMGAFSYGDAETRATDIDTEILRGSLAGRVHPGRFRLGGWRPFAGLGYSYSDIDVDGAPSSKTEDALFLEGGLQRMMDERFVFEAGIRARTELEDGYVDGQAFAGVQFLFNRTYPQPPRPTTFERPEPVAPPKDSDGDGVNDPQDLCPDTPRGALVDADGCAETLTREIRETLYVEFDLDGTEVKPTYFDEIGKLADLMTQYPSSRILLEGHTDSTGSGGPSDPRIPADNSPGSPNSDVAGDSETFCSSDSTVFEVTEFVPANGAQGIETNRSLRVTFNAAVDEASVNQNTLPLTINGNATLASASYSVLGTAVVINPVQDLQDNTRYTVTATSDLRALCDQQGDQVKSLADADSASFMTGDQQDNQGPTAVASSPEDGETLAPTDSTIFVEFDEEIDPQSVTANSFTVTEIDGDGNAVGTVDGVLSPLGNSIRFEPTSNLDFQTFYEISVDTTITDLAGNGLVQPQTYTFRTGGLVVLLDNTLLAQPQLAQSGSGFDSSVLMDGLDTLSGTLLSALEFGDAEDGLNSLDHALILQIPLVEDLLQAMAGLSTGDAPSLDDFDPNAYSSSLVAVCDPKSISTTDPQADCALGLDLGLDATQLQSLAEAFTGGNPEQIPALIQAMAEAFASGDFNNLPPELAEALGGQLFPSGDGFGVEFRLVDDSSVPLPSQAEDALLTVLDAFNAIPVLGELFNLTDNKSLVDLGLFEGSLLGVDLGGLASLDVLSGTETFIGEKGVLNLGGALFDLLLELVPEEGGTPGGDLPLSPADLPLIGDLLNMENSPLDPDSLGQLRDLLQLPEDFDFDPQTLPLIGDILAALPDDFPGDLPEGGAEQLPLIGDLIQLLDPANLGEFDGNPLTDLLNPDQLSEAPLLGDLLGLLPG